ncbi:uncharacterized protein LOC143430373 [Xylocopa sonorina]|uniref:uncharacterized protein LOC143430373 n=1 Tax=Xylocopa sonorina TaxID=1818115 RepID=UPI00403B14CD
MMELVLAAEPYHVFQHPSWAGDLDDSVLIVQSVPSRIRPIAPVARGHGFVAVDWADCLMVGVYAPTSWPLSRFDMLLDELQNIVSSHAARPVFVLGDFNAHAFAWQSRRMD